MRLDFAERALAANGRTVTLRRLTGTGANRATFDVTLRVAVNVGADSVVVGSVMQTADRVIMLAREMDAARWPRPPRHGDQIIYEDGRTTVVQGTVMVYPSAEDTAYVLRTLGGS